MDSDTYSELEKIRISKLHEKPVLNQYLNRLKNYAKETGKVIFDPLIIAIKNSEWLIIYGESLKFIKELNDAKITNYDDKALEVIDKTKQQSSPEELAKFIHSTKEEEIFKNTYKNLGKILTTDVKNKKFNSKTFINILNKTQVKNVVFIMVDDNFPSRYKRDAILLCESKLDTGIEIIFGENIRNISLDRKYLIEVLKLSDRIVFNFDFDSEQGLCIDYDTSLSEDITEYELKEIVQISTKQLIREIQFEVNNGGLLSWLQLFEIESTSKKTYFDLFDIETIINDTVKLRDTTITEDQYILIYNTIRKNIRKIITIKQNKAKS